MSAGGVETSRREALMLALVGTTGLSAGTGAIAGRPGASPETSKASVPWAQGIEGQRKADLGDGRYLNPVLSGDYPDPSILKDGDDYYMTHSSFDASPGLLIWHSRDLVNWTPVGPALPIPLGTVFAVDLVKHDDRFYIYIPFMKAPWSRGLASFANIYVINAPSMAGPWSAPIDMKIGGLIDPGHAVGEDGRRYLFLSGVNRVRLSADGLSTDGPIEKVYDGWRYPDDWITESYALEGPKLTRRGEYFYLTSAVGGTGGPPTGHMVIVARSRSIHGPWENCPHNPLVRTTDVDERWWSRGHATLFEGPGASWSMVYHGYENGFRTLGRQTLLDPVAWWPDGWPIAQGGDLSMPLAKPGHTRPVPHGLARSDDFSQPAFGTRWSLYGGGIEDGRRARLEARSLILQGRGVGPQDSPPLTQQVGDHAYMVDVTIDLIGEVEGGLLLYFDDRLFLGMGCNGTRMTSYRGGKATYWQEPAPAVRRLDLRIVNDRNIVTFYYRSAVDRAGGGDWIRHAVRSETSGYTANTMDDLTSLRPALFSAGSGSVRFENFRYRALN